MFIKFLPTFSELCLNSGFVLFYAKVLRLAFKSLAETPFFARVSAAAISAIQNRVV